MNNTEIFEKFLVDNIEMWASNVPECLIEGIKYSLFGGGKRIRPMMLLETHGIFREIDDAALYFAAGIECYHTFTLIHDDLPCMDNDDYRRGRLTSHKVFGEGQAVLIGDALQNLAYTFIIKAVKMHRNKNKVIEALEEFNKFVGAEGLIGGQSVDILDNAYVNRDTVEFIYRHKTCDLICASVKCGAILSGASKIDIKNLTDFAYHYGYIFQLTDDILDGDTGEEKSILRFNTENEVQNILQEHIKLAQKSLSEVTGDVVFLNNLLQKTITRTY